MRNNPLRKLSMLALSVSLSISSGAIFAAGDTKSNQFWWPERLDLSPLRAHAAESSPTQQDFDYAKAFCQRQYESAEGGHRKSLDHISGLVAG